MHVACGTSHFTAIEKKESLPYVWGLNKDSRIGVGKHSEIIEAPITQEVFKAEFKKRKEELDSSDFRLDMDSS